MEAGLVFSQYAGKFSSCCPVCQFSSPCLVFMLYTLLKVLYITSQLEELTEGKGKWKVIGWH